MNKNMVTSHASIKKIGNNFKKKGELAILKWKWYNQQAR